ncbi:hypothetical protein [Salinibacillus kushneri]|uniref:hypothetical protein n=1 Tax=Salinibacillus kushneri TaxID=237682 RepID=UPI0015A70F14|nr:hypothetical protein [Salinibacillus kushneri]
MELKNDELLKMLKEFYKSTPAKKAKEILQVVKEHGCWENKYQQERINLIKSYIGH